MPSDEIAGKNAALMVEARRAAAEPPPCDYTNREHPVTTNYGKTGEITLIYCALCGEILLDRRVRKSDDE